MVKRHKGKLKRAPPASHLATSPLAEVEPKGSEVLFGEMSPGGEAFMASNSGATRKRFVGAPDATVHRPSS